MGWTERKEITLKSGMSHNKHLFPAHPKPHRDEVLTSWVIRLAKANGLKLQAFSRIVFEGSADLWNRDIDRKPYDWLLTELSERTGCLKSELYNLTLQSYKGKLFSHFHEVGVLKWILPLNIYHRKRKGFGQQYCSECLKEDKVPYFRKHWRVAFNTFCVKHNIMLRDRCPKCGYPIMFHRNELGKPKVFDGPEMCYCTTCDFDLSKAKSKNIRILDKKSFGTLVELLNSLQSSHDLSLDVEHLAVLRQFCKLINSRVTGQKLCRFLTKYISLPEKLIYPNGLTFEVSEIGHRHITIQLACWILFDYENRIELLWENKVVRYNYLAKDFHGVPSWYNSCIKAFNRIDY